ncbi:MAG: hypothetical protein E7576_07900 [Ruminococcaceae bacterium]|jgi:hypothetical protein|nr:hypothetical protein [Oscillospiraceae bacterium]
MARAIQPVQVAGIEFDALIEETRQLDAEIPQYSTEEGFQISDAIIIDAETISMTLFVTDTPVTWRDRHGGAHMGDVCSRLEAIYFNKEPITISTTDANYTDMGIQSITFSKSFEVGYSREIPITFKKIRKTRTRTIAAPSSIYPSGGMTGQTTGQVSTEAKNTAEPGSIMYGVYSGLTGGSENTSTPAYTGQGTAAGARKRTSQTVQGTINNHNSGGGYNPSKNLTRLNQIN